MHEIIGELKKLESLLHIEKEADLEEFKRKIEQSPTSVKVEQGLCWYPITIQKYYYGTGERLIVEIARTSKKGEDHLFQPGKVISLFTQSFDGPIHERQSSGVVNYVKGDMMSISLNADELPDWSFSGKLGLQLMFDEASYREMFATLKTVIKASGNRLAFLRDVLLGHTAPSFVDVAIHKIAGLNDQQQVALERALAAKDVAVIHGPPGTGKTTTLVEVIVQTLRTENQVLVCAPSNAAVDLLASKLSERGMSVLRLGHPARVTDEMMNNTLDVRITNHPQYKDLRALRKKATALRQMAAQYKRTFGRHEREQRRMLQNEVRNMRDEAKMLENYITADLLTRTRVIACTLVGAANDLIGQKKFPVVFIDEAAQALEPACWIPILKAQKVVFAGDHCQLPPTVKSYEAAKQGLTETLMEKIAARLQVAVMLRKQYRMHEEIMAWSSQQFYQNELEAAAEVANRLIMPEDSPIQFIDTAGCGFEEHSEPGSRSTANREEAQFVLKLLSDYLQKVFPVFGQPSVALITPYKAQVEVLRELLPDLGFSEDDKSMFAVNTVDAFQGQERDVIFMSLVRSNTQGEIGFLQDIRRMNVSMTRARMKLVMVGDSSTLGGHPFYHGLVGYLSDKGFYQSAFEYF